MISFLQEKKQKKRWKVAIFVCFYTLIPDKIISNCFIKLIILNRIYDLKKTIFQLNDLSPLSLFWEQKKTITLTIHKCCM